MARHAAALLLLLSLSAQAQTFRPVGPSVSNSSSVTIDPRDPSILYMTTSGAGLFRSTSSGVFWSKVSTGGEAYATMLAISPAAGSATMLAAVTFTSASILRTDDGLNWTPSHAGMPERDVTDILFDPINPSIAYAATAGSGIYRSLDGGRNWTAINTGLDSLRIGDLAIHPGQPSTLLATSYADPGGGVFRTLNRGDSWVRLAGGLGSGPYFSALVDPSSPSLMFAAGAHSVFRSADSGANWSRLLGGAVPWHYRSLAVGFGAQKTFLVSIDGGLISRSVNDGDSWSSVAISAPSHDIRGIAITPSAPLVAFAATAAGVYRAEEPDLLNTPWRRSNLGATTMRTFGMAASPVDRDLAIAASPDSGLVRTSDGGRSWLEVPGGSVIKANAVAFDPSRPGTVYAAGESGFHRSEDSGRTWAAAGTGLPGTRSAIAVAPDGSLVMSAGSGVYRSFNGGSTFERRPIAGEADSYDVAIDPVVPSIAYVALSPLNVMKTINSAETWTSVAAGLPENVQVYALHVRQDRAVLAATSRGIFRSSDGGDSWSVMLDSGFFYDILSDPVQPATIYGASSEGVFRSRDDGATWTLLPGLSDYVFSLATDPLGGRVWAGSGFNGVYRFDYPQRFRVIRR